jgi:hypothetical protein
MFVAHRFISTVPPAGNNGDVQTSNWNDIHQSGFVPTAYNASGVVPATINYIRATGGSGGIALQLTSGSQVFNGPTGEFTLCQAYFAKKVDAGAGAITFTDSQGALIENASSYELTQQGQWALFIWNGTTWDVFGGMAA